MKLFFALLLMSMVLFSEVHDLISTSDSDIILLDTSFEGESEKEASENIEDTSKVKIKQNFHFSFLALDTYNNDSSFRWPGSTSYLEIHSPPPE